LSCFDEDGAAALTAAQLRAYITALAPQLPGLAGLFGPSPASPPPAAHSARFDAHASRTGSAPDASATDAPGGLRDPGHEPAERGEGRSMPAVGACLSSTGCDTPKPNEGQELAEAAGAEGGLAKRGCGSPSGEGQGAALAEYAAFAARKLMFLHARQGRRAPCQAAQQGQTRASHVSASMASLCALRHAPCLCLGRHALQMWGLTCIGACWVLLEFGVSTQPRAAV
jgi:hypothetical protein